MNRAGVWIALALALWPAAAGPRAQDRAPTIDAADRPDRVDRPDASSDAGDPAAPEAIVNQPGVVRHRAQGYRNLWFPNLESPPEDSLSADGAEGDERLGTRTRSLVDERPLWRMLSQEEYANARAWLDKFREWHPDWEPSEDLLRVLQEGELLAQIAQARETGDWATIEELAARHPEQFACETVFNLWALAEARAAREGGDGARAVYQEILDSCPRPVDRLVTLQRAAATIGHAATWPLVQREARRELEAEPAAAFRQFRTEFNSAWLARAIERGAPEAGTVPARELAQIVRADQDSERARLLGWYAMEGRAYPTARRWFARAQAWEPSADGAYGLALAWLRDGRRGDAFRVARAWQGTDPRFDALLAEIASLRARRAFDAGDYAAALDHAEADLARYVGDPTAPAARELRRIRAWSLFNLERTGEALEAFTALYTLSPDDPDLAAPVIYSGVDVGDFETVRRVAREHRGALVPLVLGGQSDGGLEADDRDLRHLFHTAWFAEAASAEKPELAIARVRPVMDLIGAKRDADTAVPLAWAYMELDRADDAVPWFRRALDWRESEGAAVGLVAALRAVGQDREAEQLARAWAGRSPVLADAARELTLARADRAYAAAEYRLALELSREARALAGSSRRGRMLAAWSHYQLGEAARAADLFEALYQEAPDAASGEGLFFAGLAAGREARLGELARRTDGPLGARWRDHLSQRYLDLDLYADSARLAQGSDPRVAGADAGHVTTHTYWRSRDGETGEGQLDVRGVQVTGSTRHGRHRFGAGLAIERLDSGRPDDTTDLGSAVDTGAAADAETRETVVLPTVSYGYSWPDISGATQVEATLGLSPLGGAVEPWPIGSIGLDRREVGRRIALEAFSKPRTDSRLSYAGVDDPGGRNDFGRVIETGLDLSGLQQLGGPWSLDARLGLSFLHGKNVEDNRRVTFGTSLIYELGLDGFDYATVGPRYAFEMYEENLSRFTFGHGGYFSPQSLHRISLGAAFQTDDGDRFVLRGSGGIGWQATDEDATVQFPLERGDARGVPVDGSQNSGLAIQAQLDGVYRLADRVALGFRADTILSSEFQEVGVGVFLRLSLDGRGGALAGDIPGLPLR